MRVLTKTLKRVVITALLLAFASRFQAAATEWMNPQGAVTPLHIAAAAGRVSWASELLAAGEDPDFPDPNYKTPLVWAVEGGQLAAVLRLIEAGADLNYDRGCTTPLALAAAKGEVEIVAVLLDAGADPNLVVRRGGGVFCYPWANTPLFQAAFAGRLQIVRMLLESGAKPVLQGGGDSVDGETNAFRFALASGRLDVARLLAPEVIKDQLALAAFEGDLALVKQLLAFTEVSGVDSRSGCPPLALAAWAGRDEVVKVLLEAGARPTESCKGLLAGGAGGGFSPLELAAWEGRAVIVRILLGRSPPRKAGALRLAAAKHGRGEVNPALSLLFERPNLYSDKEVEDAVVAAAGAGQKANLVFLLARRRLPLSARALEAAVDSGEVDTVLTLLNAGAEPGGAGGWLLERASKLGYRRTVELFVSRGVRPGAEALLWAINRGDLTLVKRLLEAGAPFRAATDFSEYRETVDPMAPSSALVFAVYRGEEEIAAYLLGKETPVAVNEALLEAARQGNSSMVKRLLDYGANPNARVGTETPLHAARSAGALRLLLAAGGDPNLRDAYGQTPLASVRNPELVGILLRAGANPNAPDQNNRTPLYHWIETGRFEPTRDLIAHGAEVRPYAKDLLKLAVRTNNVRILTLVSSRAGLAARERPKLLCEAAGAGAYHVVAYLIDEGTPPDVRCDALGRTPLILAASGNKECFRMTYFAPGSWDFFSAPIDPAALTVKALLSRGADVATRDAGGKSALHYAALRGCVDRASPLIEAGADLHATDQDGRTPLDLVPPESGLYKLLYGLTHKRNH